MPSAVDDPRWGPIREAIGHLPRHGVRLWWIREDGEELLRLRCVEDTAEALKAKGSELLEADSDGRPEAVIQIFKQCIEPRRTTTQGRVLWTVLDLDGEAVGTTAEQRRTIAGKVFRGEGSPPVKASTIRQIHEPRALDWLTTALLAYEDAHIARHDD